LFLVGDLATINIMNKLAQTLIDTGVLAITGEDDATKTLRLVVPSLWQKDRKGRIKIVSITWIHPDYNAQFCHYYHLAPGDLPNFLCGRGKQRSAGRAARRKRP
jgi:hypothetical protein